VDRLYYIFVKSIGLPLDYFDGILRAMPQTGTQTIAIFIADQSGFTVYYLERTFHAVWDAQPAAVALVLVYLDYFSFHSAFQLSYL
jgi:hypothetical protein